MAKKQKRSVLSAYLDAPATRGEVLSAINNVMSKHLEYRHGGIVTRIKAAVRRLVERVQYARGNNDATTRLFDEAQ